MWSQRAVHRLSSQLQRRVVLLERQLGTKAKKGSAAEAAEDNLSYYERKAQRKEAKRQAYQNKVAKQERNLHRRKGVPKGVLKNQFKEWWLPKQAWQEMMDRKARQAGKEWKICVAAIVERIPIVLPDKKDWEVDFEELQAYLGQFGKEYPKELFPDQSLTGDDNESDSKVPITDEELFACLPDNFKPAPRETEADHSGDIHTMDRRLKDRVFLVVKDTAEDDDWMFPTVEIQDDETLLQAAQRAAAGVSKSMELYCPSNAPMAVDMQVFKDGDVNDKYFGVKTFFYRVQYDDGKVPILPKLAWLDRQEIVDHMQEQKGEDTSKFYHYML